MKIKEESEKAGLKLNIQKTKIMASGPITSCQIDGETMETVTKFISLGSKITVDSDFSHEIKGFLLFGRKVMTNLDSILKSRGITLPTKVHLVEAMVFPEVMYGCESWTIDKAELQRINAFELWCWRRLLRVLWTARRSNQFILKEINPEYSLEGLMLKLRLHYFGHLMRWVVSLEKTWTLAKIEGRRRRGWQRVKWLDGITDSMNMSLVILWEIVKNREAWHGRVHGVSKSLTWLSDWKKITTSWIPGQGTRSHKHQLRIHMTQWRSKIPRATTKILLNQIDKDITWLAVPRFSRCCLWLLHPIITKWYEERAHGVNETAQHSESPHHRFDLLDQ